MNRRTVLKGGLILAATAHTAVGAPEPEQAAPVSVDVFLATATSAEKARYHANALAEAMNELRPGAYIVRISPQHGFALIVGNCDPVAVKGPRHFEDEYWQNKVQAVELFAKRP